MSDQHAYDTRPEAAPRTNGDSPVVWAMPQPIHVNIWVLLFELLVLTPACIYLGLLALTAAGLVTP